MQKLKRMARSNYLPFEQCVNRLSENNFNVEFSGTQTNTVFAGAHFDGSVLNEASSVYVFCGFSGTC